jgi:hypothetical protein
MLQDPLHDENPYASPECSCPPGVGPDGEFYSTKAPADVFDIVLDLFYLLVLCVVMLGVPCTLAALVGWNVVASRWLVLTTLSMALLATAPVIVWLGWFFRTVVASVVIDDDGVHFLRYLSAPDDWPWTSITFIRPATRWEVLWAGMLRPLLFPRERSNCSSLLGHYRIQGKTDYCFFPPKNPEAFVEAIARYRPDLLQR